MPPLFCWTLPHAGTDTLLKTQVEWPPYTDKKENKIFLIYKEIQNGAVAKSYMRKGFLMYEEMRKYLTIYEEAVSHMYMTVNCSIQNFLIYEKNFIFFFICVLDIAPCRHKHLSENTVNITTSCPLRISSHS